ncbi:hypothetical protein ETB97_005009 [Aspergillus alliaceus]|uniref:Nucleoside phosphorylase domain-containing protein n=1 Tax=Petromyces alliaceus TaxID=209559 RepID=A0A8H5ZW38_PETAA|nr:hypothetical protein ETB97_005009 [Aspergillus burnettii]
MGFRHDDYTVAWICALPLEMTAAKAMLDKVHPSLPQPETDHNVYTLGNVAGHNVVMACLPAGVYGTTSAAIVLAHMLPTFPSLRFGLMVGIGGGVPSKNADIRLGDVVVSMPTAGSGGVIQYDYGKTLRDGGLQRTGSLNKPPQYLLTAVSQIRSDYMIGDSLIKKGISETLQKHQKIHEQFSRPDQDWLYKPGYDHASKTVNCSLCDPSQLVVRTTRENNEPAIHYGLIASGNQVMKNAKIRDSIAQELDILCFEMEAAGMMDQLPCLVIRGICDYCDSHKHKQWQGYSALAAAVYARALLEVVPLYNNDLSREKRSFWMVPFARNPRFVGRQNEIHSLEQSIIHSRGPTKTAICGLGGIGKTQIALELAYRAREKVPGISIFWIPCTSYENVEQAYLSLASSLGITDIKPAEVKEQIKTFLSQEHARRWLLIFDNADDIKIWTKGSATAPPLKDILPQSEHGHILFTSRNRKLAVKLASPNVLSIPDLDLITAKEILKKLLIQKQLLQDDCATTALLEQLGFLPLAISQAAAYINENEILLSEYLSLLGKQERSIIEMLSEEFEDDGRYAEIRNPVATTWWISFLQIRQLDELAADYLSFMACIDPRVIPHSILPPAPSAKKQAEALGLLKAYSFISSQARDGLFSLHRLVHLATRNWMRINKILDSWVERVTCQLDDVFPDNDHDYRRIWRDYLPHVLYLTESEEFQRSRHEYYGFSSRIGRCLQSDGRYNEAQIFYTDVLEIKETALGPEHPDTLTSASNLGSVLEDQGKYEEAEAMHLRALKGREKALGPMHPDTLTSVRNLGSVFERQGKYKEAEAMHQRALQGYKKVLGPEHPDTLTSVSNLGSVLQKQGKYKEAEAMHLQALKGIEKALGPEHPDTLTSVSNLGSVLEQQGKYEEAEAMHRRDLKGSEKILGPEHPDTLTSVSNLGSVLGRQGKYEEAEAMHLQALKGREKALGPMHPDTLTSVSNLGLVLEQQGKYKEAEAMYQQDLKGSEKILGPEHPDTLTSVSKLGSVLQKQGKYKEAEAMHRRDLKGSEKVLGPEHPDTLTSISNLGSVLEQQGKYEEAEAMHQRALQGYEKVLGPEHPYTLSSVSNLGSVLERQGKYEETETMHRQAQEGYKKALGPEHPYTLTSVSNLGSVLRRQGKYEEAEAMNQRALQGYEKQALQGYKKVLGPEHPDTLTSVSNLGLVLEDQGKYKEAEAMYLRALKGREKALGPMHPDTLTSVSNLGLVLEQQGKYKEAEAMHQQTLEGREKALGPMYPDTLTSVSNLGSVLQKQGKYKEAEAMHRQDLKGLEKILGPKHPDTLTSVSNLGSVLEQQGRYEEAEAMYQRALQGYEKVLGPEHPYTLTIMNNLAHTWILQDKMQDALALMGKCLELRNRILGFDHPDTQSSSRSLYIWKKNYTSLPTKQLQVFIQAEHDQVREIATESPEVVVTKLTGEEHITLNRRQEQLTTPVKQFIANHPLRAIIASNSSARQDHGITEVD